MRNFALRCLPGMGDSFRGRAKSGCHQARPDFTLCCQRARAVLGGLPPELLAGEAGTICLQVGRPAEAVPLLEEAVALEPRRPLRATLERARAAAASSP